MPVTRGRSSKGLPKRKIAKSTKKNISSSTRRDARRSSESADDAISEASSTTKYELVSDDEVEVSDHERPSIFEVPSSSERKRIRPDDVPSSFSELLDQQIALQKAQQLNEERIKAFSSMAPVPSTSGLRNNSLSRVFQGDSQPSTSPRKLTTSGPVVIFPSHKSRSFTDPIELPTIPE